MLTSRSTRRARTAALSLGGVTLFASLAGCATSGTPAAEPDDAGSSDTGSAAPGTAAGTYTDGDYSAEGDYQSPAGGESIEVELTLEGGVVTAVTVTPGATDGNAVRYQEQFAGGIGAEVVGQPIDQLSVDKVAGSSLTSDGFNDAVEQIKSDALA